MCSTWVSSDITCKYQTRLERPAMDKHSSLLRTLVIYGCKGFYNICLFASALTFKYQTRLERPAMDKNCSLLRTLVIYSCKRFYKIGHSLLVSVNCDASKLPAIFFIRMLLYSHTISLQGPHT